MGCEVHDYLYVGACNVLVGEELLKVLEAWRCRACGAVLAGERPMGPISSTEGILGSIAADSGERWLVVVKQGRGSLPPDAVAVRASPGSRITVDAADPDDSTLLVGEDWSVVRQADGSPPRTLRAYDLLSVLKGYIDLSVWPPKVFTLQRGGPRQL
ncbi:MAG: hypothetical protein ABDH63_05430 [Candidatus Caldarchaeales archaeon]